MGDPAWTARLRTSLTAAQLRAALRDATDDPIMRTQLDSDPDHLDAVLRTLLCFDLTAAERDDADTEYLILRGCVPYLVWNLESRLQLLADLGITGTIDVTDRPARRFTLAGGTVTQHHGRVYYPTQTDPDEPTVLLTGRQARAALALITGDPCPDHGALAAALAATLR